MKTLIVVIGVVMIIEGIPYFGMPNRVKEVASKIVTANERTLRLIGLGLMIGGLIIVAFGRLG